MKISACYIVRNEADNLRRSIESLHTQVEEIIVVDTGSTDKTKEIAMEFGAKIYCTPWQDDFSLPRNLALSKATGDWLILLDADEYFTQETAGNIRRVIVQNPSYDSYAIMMLNYDKVTKTMNDPFYQVRIVRNIPGLQYKGIIHEELYLNNQPLAKCVRVAPSILQLIHTGYSTELSEEKARRNLRLLDKAMTAGDSIARLSRYYCISYAALRNDAKMLLYGWQNIQQGRQKNAYASVCHRLLLNYYTEQNTVEAAEKRLALIKLTVNEFPELPDFHAEYGEVLFQWRQYKLAAAEMLQAMQLYDGYEGVEPCQLTLEQRQVLQERYKLADALAKDVDRLRITACIIVRNEEQNIRKWLANVRYFADEIIIVDTGSEDGTLDYLQEQGIGYYSYQWQDDFGAARNYAIDKASGSWLVFLDADETFKYPASIRGGILDLVADQGSIDAVGIPLHNIDIDDHDSLISREEVLRVFPKRHNLGYIGKIHEQWGYLADDKMAIEVYHGNYLWTVQHTGYSGRIIRQKTQRNLSMLLANIYTEEDMAKYAKYLAECYFTLGDFEIALNYALRAIQSPYQSLASQGEVYWIALETMQILEYTVEDRLAVVIAAVQAMPELPDFWGYWGSYCLEEKQWKKGYDFLDKAFSLYENSMLINTEQYGSCFTQMKLHFQTNYALAAYHIGLLDQARVLYQGVLAENKWYDDALLGLVETYPVCTSELCQILQEYYCSQNDWQKMYQILWEAGFFSVCQKLGHQENRGNTNPFGHVISEVANESLVTLLQQIKYLFIALLSQQLDFSSYMVRSQLNLLPRGLQSIIYRFHNYSLVVGTVQFGDYKSMLEPVLHYGQDNIIIRYLELTADFTLQEKSIIKDTLYSLKKDYYWKACKHTMSDEDENR